MTMASGSTSDRSSCSRARARVRSMSSVPYSGRLPPRKWVSLRCATVWVAGACCPSWTMVPMLVAGGGVARVRLRASCAPIRTDARSRSPPARAARARRGRDRGRARTSRRSASTPRPERLLRASSRRRRTPEASGAACCGSSPAGDSIVPDRGRIHRNQFGHLVGVGHADRVELAQQPVASGGRGAGDRPRHRPERPPERGGVAGGVERPGSPARFDHDGGRARRGDEPVALEEAPFRRRRAARDLGHDGAGSMIRVSSASCPDG